MACHGSNPVEADVMGKQRIKPNYRRRVLRLPDPDDQDGTREFWVSESGILLSIKVGKGDRGKTNLTQYHGPSLGS